MMIREADYTLEIEGTPPSINEFTGPRGRFKAKSVKNDWANFVGAEKVNQRVPFAVAATVSGLPGRKRRVRVTITFPEQRKRDPQNYMKILWDSMVQCGVLFDDSPEWCIDDALPTLRVEKDVSRTVIQIWEVDDGTG